jgi:ribosomal protein L21E
MPQFIEGDRVRVDIPDETDPDHRLHGEHGTVVSVLQDDAGTTTGDERDDLIYRVELDEGQNIDLRWRDLRPPIE